MNFFSIRIFIVVVSAFILFVLAGCKSSSTTPSSSAPTGVLSGRVLLYSGAGGAITVDTGVTVSVSGSSVTASTNDSGKWVLPVIEAGNYTLTFTQSGFGSVMQFGVFVPINDTIQDSEIVMSEPLTLSVGFNDYEIIAPRTLSFTCTMPKGENLSVVFCMSTDSASLASDPSNAEWTFLTSGAGSNYDGGFAATDGAFSIDSIAHGTVIYATVCVAGAGTNYQSFSSYYDPVGKREVYSALGPHSGIIAKTIP